MVRKRKVEKMDKGPKTKLEKRVERFIVEQMDRYIHLHKEHEKDLSYIG